jgi:hypothetical protein
MRRTEVVSKNICPKAVEILSESECVEKNVLLLKLLPNLSADEQESLLEQMSGLDKREQLALIRQAFARLVAA